MVSAAAAEHRLPVLPPNPSPSPRPNESAPHRTSLPLSVALFLPTAPALPLQEYWRPEGRNPRLGVPLWKRQKSRAERRHYGRCRRASH
eukprot:2439736-Rhodomonas_salina.1